MYCDYCQQADIPGLQHIMMVSVNICHGCGKQFDIYEHQELSEICSDCAKILEKDYENVFPLEEGIYTRGLSKIAFDFGDMDRVTMVEILNTGYVRSG